MCHSRQRAAVSRLASPVQVTASSRRPESAGRWSQSQVSTLRKTPGVTPLLCTVPPVWPLNNAGLLLLTSCMWTGSKSVSLWRKKEVVEGCEDSGHKSTFLRPWTKEGRNACDSGVSVERTVIGGDIRAQPHWYWIAFICSQGGMMVFWGVVAWFFITLPASQSVHFAELKFYFSYGNFSAISSPVFSLVFTFRSSPWECVLECLHLPPMTPNFLFRFFPSSSFCAVLYVIFSIFWFNHLSSAILACCLSYLLVVFYLQ